MLPTISAGVEDDAARRTQPALRAARAKVAFIVSEANTLAISAYDVHPYIDGNTRVTWHLRNYALMLDALRPLLDLRDEDAYNRAWWAATPFDHEELDEVVRWKLDHQDR